MESQGCPVRKRAIEYLFGVRVYERPDAHVLFECLLEFGRGIIRNSERRVRLGERSSYSAVDFRLRGNDGIALSERLVVVLAKEVVRRRK